MGKETTDEEVAAAMEEFNSVLAKGKDIAFVIKCSIGARDDLGRPTTTALENKQNFMEYLSKI